MPLLFQSPDHYQTNYPGYPGYAGYAGGGHHAGYYSGYPSKQSAGGYSDQYPMSAAYPSDKQYQYYPNCQQQQPPPDPSTANTPLPPDFSYVGSGGPHGQDNSSGAAYNDFYAMG